MESTRIIRVGSPTPPHPGPLPRSGGEEEEQAGFLPLPRFGGEGRVLDCLPQNTPTGSGISIRGLQMTIECLPSTSLLADFPIALRGTLSLWFAIPLIILGFTAAVAVYFRESMKLHPAAADRHGHTARLGDRLHHSPAVQPSPDHRIGIRAAASDRPSRRQHAEYGATRSAISPPKTACASASPTACSHPIMD